MRLPSLQVCLSQRTGACMTHLASSSITFAAEPTQLPHRKHVILCRATSCRTRIPRPSAAARPRCRLQPTRRRARTSPAAMAASSSWATGSSRRRRRRSRTPTRPPARATAPAAASSRTTGRTCRRRRPGRLRCPFALLPGPPDPAAREGRVEQLVWTARIGPRVACLLPQTLLSRSTSPVHHFMPSPSLTRGGPRHHRWSPTRSTRRHCRRPTSTACRTSRCPPSSSRRRPNRYDTAWLSSALCCLLCLDSDRCAPAVVAARQALQLQNLHSQPTPLPAT